MAVVEHIARAVRSRSMTPESEVLDALDWAPPALRTGLHALAADLQRAYAPNTLRIWRNTWRLWADFCARMGYETLPASLDAVRAFLTERIEAGRQRATLALDLATLATVHRLAAQPWVLDTMAGRLMWRGLRRERLRARQRQAQGLPRRDLKRLLEPMSETELHDVRDAALMCLAYETMSRRSELVTLRREDLWTERDGSGRMLLTHSKTDQEGEGAMQFVSVATMKRLAHWCALAGIERGPLFRAIPLPWLDANAVATGADADPNERYPKPLSVKDVARIFKRRARAAGVDPTRISAHSTRVGATQDLLEAGFSAAAIMQQGRWKSERMVVRYGEHIAAGQSAMAQLLATPAAPTSSPDSEPDSPAGPP